jgi:hypothetical protein
MGGIWSEAPRRGAVARAQVASLADVRAIERTPDACVLARFWDLVDAHSVTLAGRAPTTAAALVPGRGRDLLGVPQIIELSGYILAAKARERI